MEPPADPRPTLRPDALGLWIAPSGKAVLIEAGPSAREALVTVTPTLTGGPYAATETIGASQRPERLPAVFCADGGFERLPGLEVEADPPIGRTYRLHLAVENDDPAKHGGYVWRPARAEDPIAAVRLIADTGSGYIDAVAYMEDEGLIPWALPFEPLRIATAEELATYRASRPAAADDATSA